MSSSISTHTSQGLAAPRQATYRLAMHAPVHQQQWRRKRDPIKHSLKAAAKGGGSFDGDVWKQLSSMADKYIISTTGQQQRPGADNGSCCTSTVLQNSLMRRTRMHAHVGCTGRASSTAAMLVRYCRLRPTFACSLLPVPVQTVSLHGRKIQLSSCLQMITTGSCRHLLGVMRSHFLTLSLCY
jgi:hypothetical protein